MTLFFQQWYGELLKLFARRRTYIGFGAFVALEIIILFLLIKTIRHGTDSKADRRLRENSSTIFPR
jgi:hypothetical protein